MKKPVKKSGKKFSKKMNKGEFEEKFAHMVAEYNKAKEELESMTPGTDEFIKQQKQCDMLFASAERFVNKQ
ncbi:hypothetical protein DZ860_06860 [Vibrio sinensis]|uniref:Uncharacterized protein n=1 Tax=Vibrio sinensis TaxID=2302434 RepID=A0A3A6QVF0_9VIBR|nr:hypothetical protein [Vibrio sinensis]RJX72874.1 hypothetical protein DZ860_06860 [Vibrio sinensis]